MAEDISTLRHRVRLHVIGSYMGQLALVLTALLAVPLAVALAFGDTAHAQRLILLTALLLLTGVLLRRLPVPGILQLNEALTITVMAFLLAGLSLAYALAAEPGVMAVDALFEGISSVTTTGLSTLGTVEGRTPSFLFLRAWGQWFGGLGIVVLTVALVSGHHAAVRRLTDLTGAASLDTATRTHARHMLIVYVSLTVLALAIILPFTEETLAATAHVLTAVSTGGFSTFDESLAGFSGRETAFLLAAAAIAGATPLPLFYRLRSRGPRALLDPELLALLASVAGVIVLLYLVTPGLALGDAIVLGASAQTTTGFTPVAIPALPPASLLVLIFAMVTGGGVGSTAGGIKMLRVLLLARLVQTALLRTALPQHAVFRSRIGRHPLRAEDFNRAALILVLFLAVIFISWLIFAAAGHPPLHALFEVCSATGTVGLSTGISAMALPGGLKLLLCADMLLGRVEIVAALVLLYPRTWIGRRAE